MTLFFTSEEKQLRNHIGASTKEQHRYNLVENAKRGKTRSTCNIQTQGGNKRHIYAALSQHHNPIKRVSQKITYTRLVNLISKNFHIKIPGTPCSPKNTRLRNKNIIWTTGLSLPSKQLLFCAFKIVHQLLGGTKSSSLFHSLLTFNPQHASSCCDLTWILIQ